MKKRRLKKPIMRLLQTALYVPAAGVADLIILTAAGAEPQRMLLLYSLAACVAANAGLMWAIYTKKPLRCGNRQGAK